MKQSRNDVYKLQTGIISYYLSTFAHRSAVHNGTIAYVIILGDKDLKVPLRRCPNHILYTFSRFWPGVQSCSKWKFSHVSHMTLTYTQFPVGKM